MSEMFPWKYQFLKTELKSWDWITANTKCLWTGGRTKSYFSQHMLWMTACYGITSWSLLATDGQKLFSFVLQMIKLTWKKIKNPQMIPTLSTIWTITLLGKFMWGTLTDWVPRSQWAQCHCRLLVSPLSSFLGPEQSPHLGHLPPTCPTMPGSECFHIAQSFLLFNAKTSQ